MTNISLCGKRRLSMKETKQTIIVTDFQRSLVDCYKTKAMVGIVNREVLIEFISLPEATGNRTLLGTDPLETADVDLDVKNRCSFFCDNSSHKFPFGNVEPMLDIPVEKDVEINS
ncbi:hypothetical protein NPIL_131001 [Nephila pilipes]|uniref:Uncharacterized protein n=1 Tax=Nephila pilipes TaxID=299642 RepID=A0A8X6U4Z8_NEPPI|nr:hypothetical protein NPIL_131001 [Nephila pilipes]